MNADAGALQERGLLDWRETRVQGRAARFGEAGDGLPVLFLHGWGLSHRAYKAAVRRLISEGRRVVAPALPGFGGSEPLPDADFSLAGYARWLADFAGSIGIGSPAVVIGHSFGGGVAIRFAHDHPPAVRLLVLVNSIGGSAWRESGSAVHSLAERPLWDWGLHFPRDLLPLGQLRRVLPVIIRDALPNAAREPRAFLRAAGLARAADLEPELEELKRRGLPIVVLWGRGDRIIPRASHEALCAAAGRARCVTVDGSHSWLLADPDAFGEVMTNVIEVAERAQHLEDAEVAGHNRRRRDRPLRRLRRLPGSRPGDEQP